MAKKHSTETEPTTDDSQAVSEYKEHPVDTLSRKSSQLAALLFAVYGGGFEAFDCLNETLKNNYLWACADLAGEVQELASKMRIANCPEQA